MSYLNALTLSVPSAAPAEKSTQSLWPAERRGQWAGAVAQDRALPAPPSHHTDTTVPTNYSNDDTAGAARLIKPQQRTLQLLRSCSFILR